MDNTNLKIMIKNSTWGFKIGAILIILYMIFAIILKLS